MLVPTTPAKTAMASTPQTIATQAKRKPTGLGGNADQRRAGEQSGVTVRSNRGYAETGRHP